MTGGLLGKPFPSAPTIISVQTGVSTNYISNLTLSNNAVATKLDVAVGTCRDQADTADLSILTPITAGVIQTSGTWAAGSSQNKLDIGVRANNTWYAVHIIKSPSVSLCDFLFSLSGTSPTLPGDYNKFRRIGWVLTDNTGNITSFHQYGRRFVWDTPFVDANNLTYVTGSRGPLTVNAPPNIDGLFSYSLYMNAASSAGGYITFGLLTSADQPDIAPSISMCHVTTVAPNSFASGVGETSSDIRIRTSSSSVIYHREISQSATITYSIMTSGWID